MRKAAFLRVRLDKSVMEDKRLIRPFKRIVPPLKELSFAKGRAVPEVASNCIRFGRLSIDKAIA